MSDNSNSGGGGIGFTGALTLVFIVLKLTHVVNWSWWWVLSPLWLGFVLFLLFLAVVAATVGRK